MFFDIEPSLRAVVEPIDNIINAFVSIVSSIFGINSPNFFLRDLVNTIINNPYLLICVSLMICGFVIGILKRLITM